MKSIKSALNFIAMILIYIYETNVAPLLFQLMYKIEVVPVAERTSTSSSFNMRIVSRYSLVKKYLASKLPKRKYVRIPVIEYEMLTHLVDDLDRYVLQLRRTSFNAEEVKILRNEVLTLDTFGEDGVAILSTIVEQWKARQALLKELDDAVAVLQQAAADNGEQLPPDILRVPKENIHG